MYCFSKNKYAQTTRAPIDIAEKSTLSILNSEGWWYLDIVYSVIKIILGRQDETYTILKSTLVLVRLVCQGYPESFPAKIRSPDLETSKTSGLMK